MIAHTIEAVMPTEGVLQISDLSLGLGTRLQIVVQEAAEKPIPVTFPLCGTFGEMHDPFEPVVASDDWNALRQDELISGDNQ